MNWSGELGIGIGAFDKEHRGIVDAINELQEAVEGANERAITNPLLHKLAEATQAHLVSEEAMMASSMYPGRMLHGMKHQRLLEQMSAFTARYSRDGAAMDRHSLNFLRDWVTTHIQSEDRNFGLWLNEHGKR